MGESIEQLHERVACTLDGIIAQSDTDPARPKGLLICTHAATVIAIGRVLTGYMPSDVAESDFRPFTASLSVFVRRRRRRRREQGLDGGGGEARDVNDVDGKDVIAGQGRLVEWRDGKGIGGGWDCIRNGDCSFLEGGEERGW